MKMVLQPIKCVFYDNFREGRKRNSSIEWKFKKIQALNSISVIFILFILTCPVFCIVYK